MIKLLTVITLTYTAPQFINKTNYIWNHHDLKTMMYSINTCRTKYKSCLVKFIKTDIKSYQALCGVNHEK